MAALVLFVNYCDGDNVDKILHKYPEITRVINWGVYLQSDDWVIELKQSFCNLPMNMRKITTDNEYIKTGKVPYKTKITHLDDVDDYDADVEIYDDIRERYNKTKTYKHDYLGNFVYNCDTREYFEV